MDPFFHHTNQTLLLQRENIHNAVQEIVLSRKLKFEEQQQQNYIWLSSIFITGHAVLDIHIDSLYHLDNTLSYGNSA